MPAAEMKMEHDREYFSMRAAEAERAENQISQIRMAVTVHKQNCNDTMIHTHRPWEKETAQHMWKALDNIEKEIDAILRMEG